MSLKRAACLALTGPSLVTIVLLVHLVMDGRGTSTVPYRCSGSARRSAHSLE